MKVVFSGTFDPITLGHLDIVQRAAKAFEQVVIAVANNPSKRTFLDFATRVELVRHAVINLQNVQVVGIRGLLADFVREQQADAVVRGLRNGTDFDYEYQLAQVQHHLAPEVDTFFLPASPHCGFISSTVVREVFKHDGQIGDLVPANVATYFQTLKSQGAVNG